jgi:hypothetical protein
MRRRCAGRYVYRMGYCVFTYLAIQDTSSYPYFDWQDGTTSPLHCRGNTVQLIPSSGVSTRHSGKGDWVAMCGCGLCTEERIAHAWAQPSGKRFDSARGEYETHFVSFFDRMYRIYRIFCFVLTESGLSALHV